MVAGARHRVFVSFVVYSRDDADVIVPLLHRVDSYLHDNFENHELIVVDDASRDATADLLTSLELTGALTLLRLSPKQGEEAAMLAGLSRANGDWTFESTAQTDWPVEFLGRLFDIGAVGTDIVAGVGRPASRKRRMGFRFLNRYSRIALPPDPETIRLVSRRALNALLEFGERVRYRRALLAATGYSSAVVRYEPSDPLSDRKVRPDRASEIDALIAFSDAGLRASYVTALVFASFSVAAGLYTVGAFLFLPAVEKGWTTLMLLISGGFTAVFIVLGIIGEYLGRILVEVRGRPAFSIGQTTVVQPTHGQGDDLPLARLAEGWQPDPHE